MPGHPTSTSVKGIHPILRIHGSLEPTKHRVLSADEVKILLYEMLTDVQIRDLEQAGEIDVMYAVPGGGALPDQHLPQARRAGRGVPDHPRHHLPTLESLGIPGSPQESFSLSRTACCW